MDTIDLNPQRNNHFSDMEVWEEDGKIIIRKMSKFLGVVELTKEEFKELKNYELPL